jgi:hypothetical protein
MDKDSDTTSGPKIQECYHQLVMSSRLGLGTVTMLTRYLLSFFGDQKGDKKIGIYYCICSHYRTKKYISEIGSQYLYPTWARHTVHHS